MKRNDNSTREKGNYSFDGLPEKFLLGPPKCTATCPVSFVKLTNSTLAGIMLSYLLQQESLGQGETVVMTDNDVSETLGMMAKDVSSARQKLVRLGFVRADRTVSPHGIAYNTDTDKTHKELVACCSETDIGRAPKTMPTPIKKLNPKTFTEKDVEYNIAELLLGHILKRSPNHFGKSIDKLSTRQAKLRKWAKHVDSMIRIDGRDPDGILYVIEWCQADSFWQMNILSTQKLRKQYAMWLEEAKNDPKELRTRQKSTFLDVEKDEGLIDFHSLRHSFGTMLAASGVHPKTAQQLMRHSDINLTMSRYTHTLRGAETKAIESMPDLSRPFGQNQGPGQKATGTD